MTALFFERFRITAAIKFSSRITVATHFELQHATFESGFHIKIIQFQLQNAYLVESLTANLQSKFHDL